MKGKVGNDKEMAHSEGKSHSKNRGEKNDLINNQVLLLKPSEQLISQ